MTRAVFVLSTVEPVSTLASVRRDAEAGDRDAQYKLGEFLLAAAAGVAAASSKVASVSTDVAAAQAVGWLRLSADAGHRGAQNDACH